jgi:hypothetical protein
MGLPSRRRSGPRTVGFSYAACGVQASKPGRRVAIDQLVSTPAELGLVRVYGPQSI